MKYLTLLAFALFSFVSCSDEDHSFLKEETLTASDHRITYYHSNGEKSAVVVFESGLGDGSDPWNTKRVAQTIAQYADVLLYDRAGYKKSTSGSEPRIISNLSSDLAKVIDAFAGNRKVILVGHSLGGMIVRDYAIAHPNHLGGILFVDPSHEDYNDPTQEEEDEIYGVFKSQYGENFGGTLEARSLVEDTEYMKTLSPLPDVPVIVLTSMKITSSQTADDREKWFNAHELLQEGISDFEHITTTASGHYIQLEQPELVINQIKALLEK